MSREVTADPFRIHSLGGFGFGSTPVFSFGGVFSFRDVSALTYHSFMALVLRVSLEAKHPSFASPPHTLAAYGVPPWIDLRWIPLPGGCGAPFNITGPPFRFGPPRKPTGDSTE